MFHFFYFIHYYPIKNSDIVTDSSLYFVTFRMTMEFAKDKISINMSKLADFSLRSLFFKSKKYNFAELKRNKKYTHFGILP